MSETKQGHEQDLKAWQLPRETRKDRRIVRLAGFVADLESELAARQQKGLLADPWKQAADRNLDAARTALKETPPDPDVIARLCATAYRMMLQGLPQDEVQLRASVLRKEAGKLGGWRKAGLPWIQG